MLGSILCLTLDSMVGWNLGSTLDSMLDSMFGSMLDSTLGSMIDSMFGSASVHVRLLLVSLKSGIARHEN